MLVAGRYRLLEPVGSGGMGRVWLARDEMLDRDVAVKEFVPPDWMTDLEKDRLRDRTLREARSAARLNHPHVVRIYDVVHAEGLPWIVMEYVPSRSLHQVVVEDGPLSPPAAARIGLDVLDALTAAHRAGVLHRDVKPHNVLIGHDGRVVLTDFGLATFVDDGSVTGPGLVVGSPQYVSPERARDGASTVESDLWSFGASLYAAVEGRSPYARENAMATLMALATEPPDPPVLAESLTPVLLGLLKHEPTDRLGAADVEERLRAVAAEAGPPQKARANPGQERRRMTTGRAVVPGQRLPPDSGPAADPAPQLPAKLAQAAAGVAQIRSAKPAPAVGESEVATPAVLRAIKAVRSGPPPQRQPVSDQEGAAPPAAPSPAARRSRLWPVLAGILVVVLLGGGGLVVSEMIRDGDSDRQSTLPAVPTPGPSTNGAAGGFSPVACDGKAPAGAPTTPQKGASRRVGTWELLAGYSFYTDPSGFRIAVPDDWTYEQVGTTVCFRDPNNFRILSVDPQRKPSGDPVQACRKEADRLVAAGALPNYSQIAIRKVTLMSKAADWEYRYVGQGGQRHALTRWYAAGGKAYAVGWITREFDWSQNWINFEMMRSTLQPVKPPSKRAIAAR
jgi:tRNA A-37 threonylcarbamoyl transferase component Bud32